MEKKIQLEHPTGKKAVSMDKGKYETLKTLILNCLQTKGELSHAEIVQFIADDFQKNQTPFEGSLEWHVEWVKLDLEAKNDIKRSGKKSPIKFVTVH